jgi:spermidine synthase
MTSLAGVSRVALPAAPIGGRQLAGLSLALASGACGLAWQFIWTQQLSNSLGHEIVAVLAVLGAFFGGLAIGAWALRRVIERSARPALWYGGLELLIAGWGLGLSLLLPALTPGLGQLIGAEPSAWRHWGLAFFLPLLLLLPVTAAMGATLPALERCWRGAGSSLLSALYSANTLGAVLGTLGVVFVAIPQLGLQATALACAALNLVCGLSALALNPGQRSAVAQAAAVTPAPARGAGAAEIGRRHLLLLLAGSGLLGIGYEVLAVRVLSQVTENTVYSYALLLAVYLLGTAAGAACTSGPRADWTPARLAWRACWAGSC